jgi:hypothetical protein
MFARPAIFILCAPILGTLSLVACAPLPAGLQTPTSTAAPPPLLPLDTLLAAVDAPVATDAVAEGLAARAGRLRARAALMRGPVLDPATRERLAAAIARGAA